MPQIEREHDTYRYTADEDIDAFLVVVEGAADKGCKLPAAAGEGAIVGITKADVLDGEEAELVLPGSFCRVLCSAAVTRGDWVEIAGSSGKVRTAAPTADTNITIVGQARSTTT